jgi:hypothetical protein
MISSAGEHAGRTASGPTDPLAGPGDQNMSRTEGQEDLVGFAAWIAALPVLRRALLSTGLAVASIALLVFGRILTLNGGRAAWALRAILLEPAGILAILGAYAVAEPRSRFSLYLSSALAQGRIGAAAWVVASLGLILEAVRWWTYQMMIRPR